MSKEEAEVVVKITIARGTAENTVGRMSMVYTEGKPAEPKPMTINTKLNSKKIGVGTRGCDPAT